LPRACTDEVGSVIRFDPFDYAFHEDPYPTYRALREEAPVYWNEELGFWALARHADVLGGFRDWEHFTNTGGISLEVGELSADSTAVLSILAMDPPRHDRIRALVSKGFTPRRVADLEPSIRALAVRYLERVREAGRMDFVADFAGRIPMDVVSEMLGVPEADRDELRGWSDTILHREEGMRGVPPEGVAASGKLLEYFVNVVAERRRRPGADLASALCAAELDGEQLSDKDIIAFLYLMIIAGNETTTKLLANAVYWLQRHPSARKEVSRGPALVPQWVEETLRFDNSTQLMARSVTSDFDYHGHAMKRGQKVLLLIGSANRDERVFPSPDVFDLHRDTSQHLSFGRGTHFCLGAALARLEARVSLEEVLGRVPDYEIDEARAVRVHSTNVRGFAALPMGFSAR
jgi:cytochrome P450